LRKENSQYTPYKADLYTWALEQTALLRAGQLEEIDARNLAELTSAFEETVFPMACLHFRDEILRREIERPATSWTPKLTSPA